MSSPGNPIDSERALARQLERYEVRFNDAFWVWFAVKVEQKLPDSPTLVDLGCGPGLFLRDVSQRLPKAKLHGLDNDQAMLENARLLFYAGIPPTLKLHDATRPLPVTDHSVDLLSSAAVMHTFQDPFGFLDDVCRVLAPGGYFLLYDWVRVSMADYIAQRKEEPGDNPPDRYPRALEMFATHNKYTLEDWLWILEKCRFRIVEEAVPHARGHAWLLKAT